MARTPAAAMLRLPRWPTARPVSYTHLDVYKRQDFPFAVVPATLASPGATSTSWSRTILLPTAGQWNATVLPVDSVGQSDLDSTGATARYLVYPGDSAPVFDQSLMSPTEGLAYTDGRIFISGRANDNQAMAQVQTAIIDGAGRYMSSVGTFTSTSASWRTAFLTSPGLSLIHI